MFMPYQVQATAGLNITDLEILNGLIALKTFSEVWNPSIELYIKQLYLAYKKV